MDLIEGDVIGKLKEFAKIMRWNLLNLSEQSATLIVNALKEVFDNNRATLEDLQAASIIYLVAGLTLHPHDRVRMAASHVITKFKQIGVLENYQLIDELVMSPAKSSPSGVEFDLSTTVNKSGSMDEEFRTPQAPEQDVRKDCSGSTVTMKTPAAGGRFPRKATPYHHGPYYPPSGSTAESSTPSAFDHQVKEKLSDVVMAAGGEYSIKAMAMQELQSQAKYKPYLDDEQTRRSLLRLMADSTIAADFLLYPNQWKEEKLRDLLDSNYTINA